MNESKHADRISTSCDNQTENVFSNLQGLEFLQCGVRREDIKETDHL